MLQVINHFFITYDYGIYFKLINGDIVGLKVKCVDLDKNHLRLEFVLLECWVTPPLTFLTYTC